MHTALWIVQGLLALLFGMAGIKKSTEPVEKLLKSGITWAGRVSLPTVRFIGIAELLAAIGLVLPLALNILPVLTSAAAAGIIVIMLLAIAHHLKYKENKAIVFNIVLLLLAAFVVYGRA